MILHYLLIYFCRHYGSWGIGVMEVSMELVAWIMKIGALEHEENIDWSCSRNELKDTA